MTMKYKVGDKVRIKSLDWYNKNKDEDGYIDYGTYMFFPCMSQFCGKTFEIAEVHSNCYNVKEVYAKTLEWTDEMIEGLVEDETKPKDMGEVSDGYHTFNELYEYRMLYNAALFNEFAKQGLYDVHKSRKHSDGEYPFGNSNWFIVMAELPTGQISNHYEMKDWGKFQIPEKPLANKWDRHTPKDVTERLTSFTTPKKEYPKTYKDCCKILEIDNSAYLTSDEEGYWGDYELGLNYIIEHFRKLIICRDAYWKIAGDEMGLGKPWEPGDIKSRYVICRDGDTIVKWYGISCALEFPTPEMRDIFYENFKKEIEECKDLL